MHCTDMHLSSSVWRRYGQPILSPSQVIVTVTRYTIQSILRMTIPLALNSTNAAWTSWSIVRPISCRTWCCLDVPSIVGLLLVVSTNTLCSSVWCATCDLFQPLVCAWRRFDRRGRYRQKCTCRFTHLVRPCRPQYSVFKSETWCPLDLRPSIFIAIVLQVSS